MHNAESRRIPDQANRNLSSQTPAVCEVNPSSKNHVSQTKNRVTIQAGSDLTFVSTIKI